MHTSIHESRINKSIFVSASRKKGTENKGNRSKSKTIFAIHPFSKHEELSINMGTLLAP